MREPVFKGQKLFGVIIALVFFIVCWTSIILISSDWNLQHFPSASMKNKSIWTILEVIAEVIYPNVFFLRWSTCQTTFE